jgi:flagellar protein FliT
MMSPEQALAVYQALADLTSQMAAAADANDWDRVVELERDCAAHVQTLKDNDRSPGWNAPNRARKAEIIHRILADDRRIRALAAPWMERLSALISSSRAQTRLANAYGAV